MKIKFRIAALALLALPAFLRADVVLSNLDSAVWQGDGAINTSYSWEDAPFNVLTFRLTVAPGQQFSFESLTTHFGWSGAGSESAPTLTLRIVDSDSNLVATTLGATLTTNDSDIYNVSGQDQIAPFQVTLATASPLTLGAGTYDLQVWDTGEQLNYFTAVPGDIINGNLSLALTSPYSSDVMPALAIDGLVVTVPEPSSVLLVTAGLGGALFLSWRRRAGIGGAV